MRVIGGALGGRRISAPPGAATRPTAEKVREALFSILGPPEPDMRVLDAFAGAGTLGLEAMSRGAAEVWFVERAPAALRCLRGNIEALGLGGACRVLRGDAVALARRWEAAAARGGDHGAGRFGWVFVDPPYRGDLAARLLAILGTGRLLAPGARVVVEHDRRNSPDLGHGCLIRTDHRRYGDTELSLYRAQGQP